MRLLVAMGLVIFIFIIYQCGPEFMQYNPYRIYKEIKSIHKRLERLEHANY